MHGSSGEWTRDRLRLKLSIINPELDIGVPGGSELLAFSDAVLGKDQDQLDQVRRTP